MTERPKVIMRTLAERESFVDGFNACMKRLRKYAESGMPMEDLMEKMEAHTLTINSFFERKEE